MSNVCSFKSWVNNLQDIAIFLAVSTLSPVSTQTLIPEVLNAAIVPETSSYNLSSIAVAQVKTNLVSISDYNLSIISFLFLSIIPKAFVYS